MYPIFILDDVYGAYTLLVCIQFLYKMMCMGRMLFSYVSNYVPAENKTGYHLHLTHISLASFLLDIGKHVRTRSDAAY